VKRGSAGLRGGTGSFHGRATYGCSKRFSRAPRAKTRRRAPSHRNGSSRAEATFVAIVVAIGALFAAEAAAGTQTAPYAIHTPTCDAQLTSQLGTAAKELCLESVKISVPPSNSSEVTVPVMFMKPGSSTTMEILYVVGSESQGHIGPKATVESTNVPLWMSVPTGKLGMLVTFSKGQEVFQSTTVVIYRYTVTASNDSEGYYALLPPYYAGIYPALAVGADPNNLNLTTLSTWAYTGVIETAESTVPSTVVGTGSMGVLNVTLPNSPQCQNAACNLISKSLF